MVVPIKTEKGAKSNSRVLEYLHRCRTVGHQRHHYAVDALALANQS
jgi:hypothetical protein